MSSLSTFPFYKETGLRIIRSADTVSWSESDVGEKVLIQFAHGTIIEDEIVSVPFIIPYVRQNETGDIEHGAFGDGQNIIGPALEVGHILARGQIAYPAIQTQIEMQQKLEDFE